MNYLVICKPRQDGGNWERQKRECKRSILLRIEDRRTVQRLVWFRQMNGSYGKIFAFVPRPIFRVLKYSLSLVMSVVQSTNGWIKQCLRFQSFLIPVWWEWWHTERLLIGICITLQRKFLEKIFYLCHQLFTERGATMNGSSTVLGHTKKVKSKNGYTAI